MVLIFGMWMVYMTVFAPKPEPQAIPETNQSAETKVEQKVTPDTAEKASVNIAPDVLDRVQEQAEQVPVDTVVVKSPLYEYHFVTRGAVISRAYLKKFPAFKANSKGNGKDGVIRNPVQLIPENGSNFLGETLYFRNDKMGRTDSVALSGMMFEADRSQLVVDSTNTTGSLTFTRTLKGGRSISIEYVFKYDSYKVDVNVGLPAELKAVQGNKLSVALGPAFLSNEKDRHGRMGDFSSYEAVYSEVGGKLTQKKLKDLTKSAWSPTETPGVIWGGVKSKYFMAVILQPDNPMVDVYASGDYDDEIETPTYYPSISYRGTFNVPSGSDPLSYSLYIGPQSYGELKKLGNGTEKLLDYGWPIIQPFSKICLVVLVWLHKYIANYSLILILFALLVKVVFYPLTIKSTNSQIKMQKVQPLMKEIQTKYKDEPQKLQQEMLALYKEHKVNPLSGCLPMLVQMPVLIGLYYVFRDTIEFRGAEAFWWINDLSQADPFYVWPVLMGLTTVLQQKLSPTPVDPKMKPMMYMMPAMMVFIFLNFPSGLVIYYTFMNFFQMGQTIYINWKYHGVAPGKKKVSVNNASAPAKKGKSKK